MKAKRFLFVGWGLNGQLNIFEQERICISICYLLSEKYIFFYKTMWEGVVGVGRANTCFPKSLLCTVGSSPGAAAHAPSGFCRTLECPCNELFALLSCARGFLWLANTSGSDKIFMSEKKRQNMLMRLSEPSFPCFSRTGFPESFWLEGDLGQSGWRCSHRSVYFWRAAKLVCGSGKHTLHDGKKTVVLVRLLGTSGRGQVITVSTEDISLCEQKTVWQHRMGTEA